MASKRMNGWRKKISTQNPNSKQSEFENKDRNVWGWGGELGGI